MGSRAWGELLPLVEHISLSMSVVAISSKQGENSRLNNLFANMMFNKFVAQDDLYHHFGVHIDHSTIYAARKRKKWNYMAPDGKTYS